jgi:hypothetical protein
MSFLGYGDVVPNSNINPAYVNPTSSTYSGSFSSNEIPKLPGLSGAKSGIDAAAGKVTVMYGGRSSNSQQIRKLKRKIKNISNIYKMKRRSHTRRLKKKLKTMAFGRGRQRRRHSSHRYAKRHSTRRRHQHGGYSQYQNNMPSSQGYSLGGNLSAVNSALANPPMYKAYDNVIDNYNHFTGNGFDSFGH